MKHIIIVLAATILIVGAKSFFWGGSKVKTFDPQNMTAEEKVRADKLFNESLEKAASPEEKEMLQNSYENLMKNKQP